MEESSSLVSLKAVTMNTVSLRGASYEQQQRAETERSAAVPARRRRRRMKPFYVSRGAAASSSLQELRRGAADERSFMTRGLPCIQIFGGMCLSRVCAPVTSAALRLE